MTHDDPQDNGNGPSVPPLLTGDQIRQRARETKIRRAKIHVPDLGGDIYVRGMSGTERDRLEERFRVRNGRRAGQVDLRNFRAMMTCRVVVDAHGNRLLNDGDADVIGNLPSGALDQIIAKCNELSGMTEEEAEDLGNVSVNGAGAALSSNSP